MITFMKKVSLSHQGWKISRIEGFSFSERKTFDTKWYTNPMILYGTTHRVGDGVTTDDIIPPDQRSADDPALLAAHCLSTIAPRIAEAAREGDVLLAGDSF